MRQSIRLLNGMVVLILRFHSSYWYEVQTTLDTFDVTSGLNSQVVHYVIAGEWYMCSVLHASIYSRYTDIYTYICKYVCSNGAATR